MSDPGKHFQPHELDFLKSLFEHSALMVGVISFVGGKVAHEWDNPATVQFLGVSQQSLMGKSAADLGVANAYVALWREKMAEAKQTQKSAVFEYMHSSEKSEVWLKVTLSLVKDLGGDDGVFLYVVDELTEHQAYEQSLHERSALLLTIADSLPWAVTVKDADRDFQYTIWNRMAKEIFNKSSEQMLGKTDFDAWPLERAHELRAKDAELVSSIGGVEISEELGTSEFLGERWLKIFRITLKGSSGRPRYVLSITEDITERKTRDRIIQEQQSKIISSAKLSSLGEMAGGIAHEINNPLTVIQWRATQLISALNKPDLKLEDIKASLHEGLSKISSTAQRIAKIIKGLRSFARVGGNDPEPLHSELASKLIDETLELCRERFRHAEIDLRIKVEQDLPVECRSYQIGQVFMNMLNNAYDAIVGSESAWVDIRVTRRGDEFIEFAFMDSGGGIPPNVVERMMEPFFTTKEIGAGTGLGLSIAKGIIESHGGRLEYDGFCKNTRFLITLKVAKADAKGKEVA